MSENSSKQGAEDTSDNNIPKEKSTDDKEKAPKVLIKFLNNDGTVDLGPYKPMIKTDVPPKKVKITSLPDNILQMVLSLLNQVDVVNVSRVNKKLNKLATSKLYKSIFVYLPEDRALDPPRRVCKSTQLEFQKNFTVVNGFKEFFMIVAEPEKLKLTERVVLVIEQPNFYSNLCYSYLVTTCPWILIDVESGSPKMLQQQLARLDVINQLQLYNDLRFSYSMEDNYSIERLYIEGVERLYSDPLAIIPHLKALTTLCIFDVTTINILKVFRRRNITNLKLKRLSLQVCKIPIRELGEIFDLREIVYFELVFFKNVRPYSDLKWLASNMPKLRDIKIVWWNASFEKIMEQLAGHRIVNVRLHSLQPKKEGDIQRCESTMPNLIKGHERSLTHFSLYSGMEEITGIWDRHKWYTRKDPSDNSKVNTHIKIFSRRKFFLKMDAYGQQQIVIAG